MLRTLTGIALAGALVIAAASAAPAADNGQFAPYAPLIGIWDVAGQSGGPPFAQIEFRWGPNKSYIWHSQSMLMNGKVYPHFEGMLAWNGVRKNLDMLLVVDLEHGRVQEQGTFALQPDGSYVREIASVYSEGAAPIGEAVVGGEGRTSHFRQTYRRLDEDTMTTSVMHETASGWGPTFPGSDHLVVKRHRTD